MKEKQKMALKVRDFASNGSSEDNLTGRVKEERRREDDDDVLSYAPPSSRRSRDIRRSGERSPEYSRVPRGHLDEKPYFGPRDPDGNIQVREQT